MSPEKEAEYKNILKKAIKVGHKILEAGGTSQDAVETIHIMKTHLYLMLEKELF